MDVTALLNETLKQKYNAFWRRESIGRCLLYISTAKAADGTNEVFHPGEPLTVKWTDLDSRVRTETDTIARTTYYGDAFPSVFVNFGPGSLAACISGKYDLAPDTIWFDRDPMIKDWETAPEIKLDETSEMWRMHGELTAKLCAASGGSFYTSIVDIGGPLDILAALRGSQELLFDLYDYPDKIKDAMKKILPMWKHTFQTLADYTLKYQDGITTWMPIWCSGRYFPLQCDFSAMLSPDMFKEFVLDDLVELTEFLDHSIYHLDGPGEIPHLDHLLSIPRLDAIQWTAGAGKPDVTSEEWFDMYQRIQAAGKGLVLFSEEPAQVENLLRHISTRGLYLNVSGCDDYTAKQLVDVADGIGVK